MLTEPRTRLTTTTARPRPRCVSPILGAALVEVEQIGSRVWQPPTPQQAELLSELRMAMSVDALVPLLQAASEIERVVTDEWASGPAEQADCQRRLHNAVHRRR
jgi:hypothetical protein